MLVGLALGLGGRAVGGVHAPTMDGLRWVATQILDPVGQVFLRLLFFVVVPLVFTSLAYGIVQLGGLEKLGPLAGRTFALFGLNMAVGVALGLVIMNVVQPGARLDEGTRTALMQEHRADLAVAQSRAAERPQFTLHQVVDMFMPRNLLGAVADFQVLPLIVFALLVGMAGTQLPDTQRRKLEEGLQIGNALMTRIVHYAMLLAPVAVAAMMTSLVLKLGKDVLAALFLFVACVLAGILIHLFGTMALLVKLLARRSPWDFFRAIRVVLVTAFSTSSSNATLPTTIQVAEENLGVSPATAGFVLPLGATMNMSGTALYEGCVVLFVAQVFGIPLALGDQFMLLVLAVISAVAVAGIPGASLPVLIGLMANFHVPPEGIALILGVDRLLDMARTTLNVAADMVTACIVDRVHQ